MADQIMTMSKERLTHQMRTLSQTEMRAVDMAIRIQLAFTI
jgi:mRNA-degrading endonuclease toxin of MazEF toxin-antitoxin module